MSIRPLWTALLATYAALASASEAHVDRELGVKFGVSHGAIPTEETTVGSEGFAIGLFAAGPLSQIELLFTREVGNESGATRHRLEIVPLRPVVASRELGTMRFTTFVGVALSIGVGRWPSLLQFRYGLLVGGTVSVGRWSVETRYRHGLFGWGYFEAPGLDVKARSLSYLLGVRF